MNKRLYNVLFLIKVTFLMACTPCAKTEPTPTTTQATRETVNPVEAVAEVSAEPDEATALLQTETDTATTVSDATAPETQEATQEAIETPPGQEPPLVFPIDIPHIGEFVLIGKIDLEKQEFSLTGKPAKERYEIGQLVIEKPQITLSNTKGLQFEANVSLFKKKFAKIAIDSFNPLKKEMLCSLTPDEPIELSITPWKSVELKAFYLFLSPLDKKVYTEIFLNPEQLKGYEVAFGVEQVTPNATQPQIPQAGEQKPPENKAILPTEAKPLSKDELKTAKAAEKKAGIEKRIYAQLIINNLKFSYLLDELKDTEFGKIVIQNATLKIAFPSDKVFTSKTDTKSSTKTSSSGKAKDTNVIANIDGLIDFSALNFNIPGKVAGLSFTGSFDRQKGSQFTATLEGQIPLIPNFLSVANAKLQFANLPPGYIAQLAGLPPGAAQGMLPGMAIPTASTQSTAPGTTPSKTPQKGKGNETFLALSGEVIVDLPEPVGEIHTAISAMFKNGKFETFEGHLSETFDFQGVVKITDAYVRYVRTTGMVEIVGKSTVLNQFDIEAHLKTFEETSGPQKGKRVFGFMGKVAPGTMLKPFAGIPVVGDLPLARDMEIGDLEFALDTNKNFKISGVTKIGSFAARAVFIKTKTAVFVKATPAEGWKITDSISALRGTPFESIDFGNISLTIASADYYDTETHLKIPMGLSFVAGMSLSDGIFTNAKMLMGSGVPEKLFVCGSASATSVGLTISVPTIVDLGNNTTMENIYLLAQYQAPEKITLAVKTQIRTRLPKQNEDSLFVGEFALNIDPKSPGVTIKATMLGFWENPLGIQGVAVGDVAFELGAALLPAPPFIRPSSVGFTGKLNLGNKKIMVATKVSDKGDIVLQGSLDGKLSLDDLLFVPRKLGAQIPNVFSEISIQDVMLKLATLDTTIGEIFFYQGLTVKGKFNFMGACALVDITVDKSGIRALGAMSEVKLGSFLTISRADFGEKKRGSTENGPIVELTLNMQKQELYMSGLMELLGSKGQTEVYVSKESVTFMTESSILGNHVKLTGVSSGSGKDIDFQIKGEMENKFYEYVNEQVQKGVNSFQDKAQEDIKSAQRDVDRLNGEISNMDDRIGEQKAKIDRLKQIVAEKTEAAKRDVADARAKVQDAQNRVDSLQSQINDLERKLKAEADTPGQASDLYVPNYKLTPYNPSTLARLHMDWRDDMRLYAQLTAQEYSYPLICWSPFSRSSWKKAAKETFNGIKYVSEKAAFAVQLSALQAARIAAIGVLEAVKGLLKNAETLALDPTSMKEAAEITKEGIELAGLETTKLAIIAAKETANGILEAAQQTAYGLGEAAKFATKQSTSISLFKVKKASIELSLNDMLTKGVFPLIIMDAKVFGKYMKNLRIQLDLKRPDRFIEDILKIVAKVFSS